jgi:hypothetical protein
MGDEAPTILLQKRSVLIPDLKTAASMRPTFSSGIEVILSKPLNTIAMILPTYYGLKASKEN